MIEKILPPSVYVKETGTVKGRGVYAGRNFSKGELIEAAVVLILTRPFSDLPPRIRRIVYNWGALTKGAKSSGLIYGYGSLYNHNNPANMRFEANGQEDIMYYFAAQDIMKDEELTVNYNASNGQPVSENDNWFKMQGITPIVD
jgi:hypothetical protein